MSQLKLISPLLDGMTTDEVLAEREGISCYALHDNGGKHYVLKILSVPSSEKKVRALILSGAYPDEAAVHQYYAGVVADIQRELEIGKRLAASGNFAGAIGCQPEVQESGVGFDVYILCPRNISLSRFLDSNAITNLRAVNLGIDLCDALNTCRSAGFLFENLKPENVFLTSTGRFLLGDLGLAPLEDLQYASVPEDYLGAYSAPELFEITASPNTTIDLYSLGMLLYRIYNGGHGPFEDENTEAAMADKLRLTGKPLPTPIYADYELSAIILKACAAKPEERFRTPEEFKQALILYMQRNEVSDTLIVPPIIASDTPVEPDEEEEEDGAPIRMTNADELDENFRHSFAPDLSGAGTTADIDAQLESELAESAPTEEIAPPLPQEPNAPEETAAPAVAPESEETPFTLPVEEERDPDQMDLDELLASVAEVVGRSPAEAAQAEAEPEPNPEPQPETHTYIDEASPRKKPESKKMRKSKALSICIILALLLAIAAVAYFLISWYFVEAKGLQVLSCTTDTLTVALESADSQSSFTLTCTDKRGTSYPATVSGNEYTFTGLTENTLYTVEISAAKHHALSPSSVSTHNIATPESTEITSFTAVPGETDGEVVLNLEHLGPAPAKWTLHYVKEDGTGENTVSFDGTSVLIGNLETDQTYVFTLSGTDTVYLSGATELRYTVLPLVQADALNVSEIVGNQVTVTWQSTAGTPAEWNVQCEAEGMETLSATTAETACVFTLPDLSRNYTFTIYAQGMSEPAVLTLPADPIVMDSLNAKASADGSVTVTWSTSSGTPAGGWYVVYGATASAHDPQLVEADGNRAVLTGLIPHADYTLSLKPADGSPVFGNIETTFRTAESVKFTDYGITPTNPYVSLWTAPTAENWDYRDLRNTTNQFTVDDEIAVCIEVNAVNSSDDEVLLQYVIRDAEGSPVTDAAKTLPWNDMWYSRRHAGVVPNPAVAGSYTLEIYINGKLLLTTPFTVS